MNCSNGADGGFESGFDSIPSADGDLFYGELYDFYASSDGLSNLGVDETSKQASDQSAERCADHGNETEHRRAEGGTDLLTTPAFLFRRRLSRPETFSELRI